MAYQELLVEKVIKGKKVSESLFDLVMGCWSGGQLRPKHFRWREIDDRRPKGGEINLHLELKDPEGTVLVWVDLVKGRLSQAAEEMGKNVKTK